MMGKEKLLSGKNNFHYFPPFTAATKPNIKQQNETTTMTNPNQFTNQATKGWTHRLWKGATYTVMSFTAVCGVMVLYGLYNFAANFDDWKADRVCI